MTTFDRREEAFENRFVHDEELDFKAHARRNHKLGLWAADLLGKQGPDAEAYAQALMAAEIEGGGSEAVFVKLQHDFAAGNVAQSAHQIRRNMDDLLVTARHEVHTL